jgi:hypothetical protein
MRVIKAGDGISRRPWAGSLTEARKHWFNKQPNQGFGIEICAILLEHGADINARDDGGMTALDWAPSKSPPIAKGPQGQTLEVKTEEWDNGMRSSI